MADAVLGIAQIEIVATLDTLSDDLESARETVSDAMDSIGEDISATGAVFASAFQRADAPLLDAIVSAGRTRDAWGSLGQAAVELAQNIEKVVLQLTVLDPLMNQLAGGGLSASGGGLGGLLGAAAPLLGFASGGDFEVGGSGGIDSQLVAFRASPGEHVTIAPSADRGGGAAPTAVTNVQVHNYSGSQAAVQQQTNSQGGKDVSVVIGEAMARDIRTNGPLGQAMRQNFGAAPVAAVVAVRQAFINWRLRVNL